MNIYIKGLLTISVIASLQYFGGMLFGRCNSDFKEYSEIKKIKKKIDFLYSENGVKLDENLCSDIAKSIMKSSVKYHIEENLIASIIKCESDFNPKATSYTVDLKHSRTNLIPLAMGLMQVNFSKDAWGNVFTNTNQYYDVYYNIGCGSSIFTYLLKAEGGDLIKVLVKYNGGYEINTSSNKSVFNPYSYCYAKKVLKIKSELDEIDKLRNPRDKIPVRIYDIIRYILAFAKIIPKSKLQKNICWIL